MCWTHSSESFLCPTVGTRTEKSARGTTRHLSHSPSTMLMCGGKKITRFLVASSSWNCHKWDSLRQEDTSCQQILNQCPRQESFYICHSCCEKHPTACRAFLEKICHSYRIANTVWLTVVLLRSGLQENTLLKMFLETGDVYPVEADWGEFVWRQLGWSLYLAIYLYKMTSPTTSTGPPITKTSIISTTVKAEETLDKHWNVFNQHSSPVIQNQLFRHHTTWMTEMSLHRLKAGVFLNSYMLFRSNLTHIYVWEQ